MSTATAEPTSAAPPRKKRGRALRLSNVSWEEYEAVAGALGERPGVRITFDRGELEIMVPSLDHDFGDRFLALLVPELARALKLPFRPGGSVTMKLKGKQKAIEGDDVFWLANASKLAGVRKLDLTVHPPPDLALEVDVSHSSMNRLRIYAKMGVPEVWRLDGDALTFHVLVGKRYEARECSLAFPVVSPAELLAFVTRARLAGDQTPLVDEFRQWLEEKLASLKRST
jgi:Uma2 family endonuclease